MHSGDSDEEEKAETGVGAENRDEGKSSSFKSSDNSNGEAVKRGLQLSILNCTFNWRSGEFYGSEEKIFEEEKTIDLPIGNDGDVDLGSTFHGGRKIDAGARKAQSGSLTWNDMCVMNIRNSSSEYCFNEYHRSFCFN